jgi:hypothetical protein
MYPSFHTQLDKCFLQDCAAAFAPHAAAAGWQHQDASYSPNMIVGLPFCFSTASADAICYECRLEQQVVSARLWEPTCQALQAKGKNTHLPCYCAHQTACALLRCMQVEAAGGQQQAPIYPFESRQYTAESAFVILLLCMQVGAAGGQQQDVGACMPGAAAAAACRSASHFQQLAGIYAGL